MNSDAWECPSCTFINTNGVFLQCAVCLNPRDFNPLPPALSTTSSTSSASSISSSAAAIGALASSSSSFLPPSFINNSQTNHVDHNRQSSSLANGHGDSNNHISVLTAMETIPPVSSPDYFPSGLTPRMNFAFFSNSNNNGSNSSNSNVATGELLPSIMDAIPVSDAMFFPFAISVGDSTISNKPKRELVFEEILMSEKGYIDELTLLKSSFMVPLLESVENSSPSSPALLSRNDINTIFSNIENVLRINLELLTLVEKDLSLPDIDKAECFVRAFKQMKDHFKIYSLYAIHYKIACEKLKKCKEQNSKFVEFVERTQKNPMLKNYTLDFLLYRPIQRICQYPLLFQELLKNTEQSHPSYPIIKEVLDLVTTIVQGTNDAKAIAEKRNRLFDIAKSMDKTPNFETANGEKLTLIEPDRHYLCEWNCMFSKKENVNLQDNTMSPSINQRGVPRTNSQSSMDANMASFSSNDSNPSVSSFAAASSNPSSATTTRRRSLLSTSFLARPASTEKKQRLVFLFSNLVLVAKQTSAPSNGNGLGKLDFRYWIDMADLVLRPLGSEDDLSTSSPHGKDKAIFPVSIVHVPNKHVASKRTSGSFFGKKTTQTGIHLYTLWFPTREEREKAYNAIDTARKSWLSRRHSLVRPVNPNLTQVPSASTLQSMTINAQPLPPSPQQIPTISQPPIPPRTRSVSNRLPPSSPTLMNLTTPPTNQSPNSNTRSSNIIDLSSSSSTASNTLSPNTNPRSSNFVNVSISTPGTTSLSLNQTNLSPSAPTLLSSTNQNANSSSNANDDFPFKGPFVFFKPPPARFDETIPDFEDDLVKKWFGTMTN